MKTTHLILGAAATALLATPVKAANAPVNTGLWEIQVTTSMGGITIPPSTLEKLKQMGINPPGGTPTTTTRQTCVTEQTLAQFGQMPQANGKCQEQNLQRSDKGMSFDLVCQNPQNNAKGHVSVTFDDRTHAHGTVKMSGTHTSSGGQSVPFDVDATQTAHWVSSDCGSVQPMK